MEFIRKYIHVAKLVKPVLTQEASDYIAEEYAKLRSHDQVNQESARVSAPVHSPAHTHGRAHTHTHSHRNIRT